MANGYTYNTSLCQSAHSYCVVYLSVSCPISGSAAVESDGNLTRGMSLYHCIGYRVTTLSPCRAPRCAVSAGLGSGSGDRQTEGERERERGERRERERERESALRERERERERKRFVLMHSFNETGASEKRATTAAACGTLPVCVSFVGDRGCFTKRT